MNASACSAVAVRRSSTTTSSRPSLGQPQALQQARVRRRPGRPARRRRRSARSRTSPQRRRARPRRREGDRPAPVEQRAGGIDDGADRVRQGDGPRAGPRSPPRRGRRPAATAPRPKDPAPPAASCPRRAGSAPPSTRASGGRTPVWAPNHVWPIAQVPVTRASPPSSATRAVRSSHRQPHPPQVAGRSCAASPPTACSSRAARRRAPPGRRARSPGILPSRSACRRASGRDLLARVRHVADPARRPPRVSACGGPRSRRGSPCPRRARPGADGDAGRRPANASRCTANVGPRPQLDDLQRCAGTRVDLEHPRPRPSQTRSTPNSRAGRTRPPGARRSPGRRQRARAARPPAAAAARLAAPAYGPARRARAPVSCSLTPSGAAERPSATAVTEQGAHRSAAARSRRPPAVRRAIHAPRGRRHRGWACAATARAIRPRRHLAGGERPRVGAPRPRVEAPTARDRAPAEHLRGAAEQRAPGGEPGDEVRPVLEARAVDHAVGGDP